MINGTLPVSRRALGAFAHPAGIAGAPTLGGTSGGPPSALTFYVVITYVTPQGESLASPEASYTAPYGDLLTVASPAGASGANDYNVYVAYATEPE